MYKMNSVNRKGEDEGRKAVSEKVASSEGTATIHSGTNMKDHLSMRLTRGGLVSETNTRVIEGLLRSATAQRVRHNTNLAS